MFVTESGNAMKVILEQTEKALYSIVVTESGIVTDGRLLHPEKHWLPINVRLRVRQGHGCIEGVNVKERLSAQVRL